MPDVDDLPPTQYLILEILAARYRLGEELWTFPARLAAPLRDLQAAGLVSVMHGITERSLRASLTDAGRVSALGEGYVTPLAEQAAELERSEAACASAMAEVEALTEDLAASRRDFDRVWNLLNAARTAARRLSSILVANAARLDTPFSDDPATPWTAFVSPAINTLRTALGMRGAWPASCSCDLHGRTCEPPSELCCENCTEARHPYHVDGSICSAPDLSGYAMPTPVEVALRAEVARLTEERDLAVAHDRQPYPTADAYEAACRALEKHRTRADAAEAERDSWRDVVEKAIAVRELWRYDAMGAAEPEIHAFVAAVDALSTQDGA